MKRIALIVASVLVLGACSGATTDTAQSGGTLAQASDNPTTAAVGELAKQICTRHVWGGIPEPLSFDEEATTLGVTADVVAAAVRRQCADTIYQPLSRAEVDWCGTGSNFGQNFFLVVEAGVDLGIESFTIVEPGLIAKATSRSAGLSDYEVELFTAELQTMSESSRFERDWAEACRSTF